MKVIEKETEDDFKFERYDLLDAFSESESNKGLIICYLLTVSDECRFVSLEVEARHEEIGVPKSWSYRYTKDTFAEKIGSLAAFLNIYDSEDFGTWYLTTIYHGAEVEISGNRKSTEINTAYPKEKKVNLLPLLSGIETATYAYNSYDKEIIQLLKKDYGMNDKRAVQTIKKLLTHQDIYDEFVATSKTQKFMNPSYAVTISGLTAKQLYSDYSLSLLGAYNYLIYLRESPEEALADLKKGLPRR